MKNFILASTSALYGSDYLAYLHEEVQDLYTNVKEIIFIPFARPGGISHTDYTQKAQHFFQKLGIKVIGLHTIEDKAQAIQESKGIFTGGGNTFLLVKKMYEYDLFSVLKKAIEEGCAYLGTSAGSNIAGINIKTTNDMPIVYPPSFQAMGLVPFCLNPHYLDADPHSTHNGETRETRILEFLTQNTNPVVGLREGNYIRGIGERLTIEGKHTTRIFENEKKPYEVPAGTDIKLLFPYLF